MLAVGLMSGTSLDGTDAALVQITGHNEQTQVQLLKFATYPFSKAVKQRIQTALDPKKSNVVGICQLNFELGQLFGDAVVQICAQAGLPLDKLDFVASHGQTLYHIPQATTATPMRSTLQIGDPAVIAQKAQTTVISNFREADMAVGGQGAPIVPYADYVLYQHESRTRILQNIGGIGNATVLPHGGQLDDVVAFDTGPGNMVIDELCRHFYHEEYDRDGRHAAAGKINQTVLSALLQHPYLRRPFPKTTGREDFGQAYVQQLLKRHALSANDWIATATAFTAQTIAQAVRQFAQGPTELIVGGGGSYNPTLMAQLKAALPEISVGTQEDLGFSSEAKEAIAMVILGNQTLHQEPSNVPSATGAEKPVILGRVTEIQA